MKISEEAGHEREDSYFLEREVTRVATGGVQGDETACFGKVCANQSLLGHSKIQVV